MPVRPSIRHHEDIDAPVGRIADGIHLAGFDRPTALDALLDVQSMALTASFSAQSPELISGACT